MSETDRAPAAGRQRPAPRAGAVPRPLAERLYRLSSLFGLLGVVALAVLFSPQRHGEVLFLTGENLANVVRAVSEIGIIAVGMTLVVLMLSQRRACQTEERQPKHSLQQISVHLFRLFCGIWLIKEAVNRLPDQLGIGRHMPALIRTFATSFCTGFAVLIHLSFKLSSLGTENCLLESFKGSGPQKSFARKICHSSQG